MAVLKGSDIGYALVIPGVGHANWGVQEGGNPIDWAKDKPVALLCGDEDGLTSDFILFKELMGLSQFSTKLSPYTGVIDSGALTATVQAIGDTVYPDFLSTATVGLNVSGLFTRRVKEADGLLATEALTSSATVIDLWSRDGNQFSEYETIYLEDETILLTTQISVSGEVQTFNCYRGAYGSRAAYHQSIPVAGARPDPIYGWDNRVYKKWDPFGKYVYVVERKAGSITGSKTFPIEFLSSYTRTWAGWLNREPAQEGNGSVLKVPIMDVFSAFFGRSLNKEPHGARWNGEFFRAGRTFSSSVAPTGTINLEANEITNRYGAAAAAADPRVVVQFQDAIVSAELRETSTLDPATGVAVTGFSYAFGPIIFGSEVSTVLMNSPIPQVDPSDQAEGEDLVEVLVGGTAMVDATGSNYTCIATGAQQPNVHHPLVCTLVFIMSTGRGTNYDYLGSTANYDRLSLKVGFGIPHELIDVTSFETAINETTGMETYGWCFGYGGSTFNWQDIRSKFLTPYGWYIHPDQNYNITVSRLEPVLDSYWSVGASALTKYSEEERLGWDDQLQSVEGEAALPWEKGKVIVARDVAQGVHPYDPDPKDPQYKLDVSAMRPIDRRGNGEKRDAVERHLEWQRRVTPVRTFEWARAGDGTRPWVGRKMRISIDVPVPWKDDNGDPLAIGSEIRGIVSEVTHDFDTNWYGISLMCINDQLVNLPSVISTTFKISEVINDAGANTTLRCFATQHGKDYNADPNFIYAFQNNDCEIWDMATGVVNVYNTGDFTTVDVQNTATDTGTGSAYFDIVIPDATDTTPVAGQYIRIVRRSVTGAETGWEAIEGQTYCAGDAETFSDGDRAKVYV
jgi:hypothetical protein